MSVRRLLPDDWGDGWAMVYARMYPEPEKGGRGKKRVTQSQVFGIHHSYLSRARAVAKYEALVHEVMAATKTLNEAFKEAKERMKKEQSAEEAELEEARENERMMAVLQREAPDLAELVIAERHPEPKRTGRGKKSPLSGDFSQQYLSRARVVAKAWER